MAAAPWYQRFDWLLFGLTVCAAVAGLVAVAAGAGGGPLNPVMRHLVARQLLWAAFGTAIAAAVATLDFHVWTDWWRPIYAVSIILLAAVLVIGRHQLGAQRWIPLGPLDLQPSEVAKLALIMALAGVMSAGAVRPRRYRDLLLPVGCAALPCLLVLKQPDLGTTLILGGILVGIVYAAGLAAWRILLALVVIAALAAGIFIAHAHWPHLVPLPLRAYQMQRLLAFLHPQADPLGTGYQTLQSEMAVGSGRVWGNGLWSGGAGGQLNYLPEATTDFVYASVGDTLGFAGAAGILVLLVLIVWRALTVMSTAADSAGALLAAGIATMLGIQTLLNIGVTLGVMPLTGVPLPWTSYGGSAALVNFAAVGILESVWLRRAR